ncbi:MAG: hypothetical protein LBM98_11610 [Oscillospiraceae bacterium]|nr:hypothetical protein [Oscillospiraceae bacterium]
MLRTCNVLRIASVPVLRNDGLGRASPAQPPAPRATQPTSNPRPIPLLGGVPPAGGGVVSPAGRTHRPNSRL